MKVYIQLKFQERAVISKGMGNAVIALKVIIAREVERNKYSYLMEYVSDVAQIIRMQ